MIMLTPTFACMLALTYTCCTPTHMHMHVPAAGQHGHGNPLLGAPRPGGNMLEQHVGGNSMHVHFEALKT